MLERAPAPGRGISPLIPLGYLTWAAAAFLVAAAGIVWLAPDLAGHYYHPRVLALTHTVTLGWITLAIMGASYQLIPVVLERPIWSESLARWQLGVLAVAVVGMVAHFYLGTWPGLAWAAALLGIGVTMHLVNIALSLGRSVPSTFTGRLIMGGHAGLGLTAVFGFVLAANHLRPILPGEFFPTLHAHVHLALLGWVTPMILGVAARVYPMFLLAPEPRPWAARVQLWGLGIGVPSVVAGLLGVRALVSVGAVAAGAALLTHAFWVIRMAHGRRRPALDWGLRFTLTGTAFVPPTTALGLALAADIVSGPRVALVYAVIALGGWISLTVVGMMLKIVPFLVWYRVYSSRAGRERVPTLMQLSSPMLEGWSYALLSGGVLLLGVSVLKGDAELIRMAGVILSLGTLAFAGALALILSHLRVRPRPVPPRVSLRHREDHAR